MKLRKGTLEDLQEIHFLFQQAIQEMNNHGIFQWDEFYPTEPILKEDILKDELFVITENDNLLSVFVLNVDFDPQYENSTWQGSSNNFIVLHRLCVHPHYQNKKIGTRTLQLLEDYLVSVDISSIRLDAFSQNPYALKMYEKSGYVKVGEAKFRKGIFYLYEKILTQDSSERKCNP